MNTIALDTNAYVAFLKGNKQIITYVQEADEIIMPFVVIGELYYGFFRGSKASENTKILDDFLRSSRVKIQDSTSETSLIFGEIAAELADKGKPMQQNDLWIAALCKERSYPLLTLDKGFENIIGLKLLPL